MNIVTGMKEGEFGEQLTAEYCVGTAAFLDIEISTECILKFVSVPAGEDGSCTGKSLRRAENGKFEDAVVNWFLSKLLTRPCDRGSLSPRHGAS